MKRRYILGATLALTSLATAGGLATSSARPAVTAGSSPDTLAVAAPDEMVMGRQDAAAAQRHARAAAGPARAARADRKGTGIGTAKLVLTGARPAAPARAAGRESRSQARAPIYSGDARGIARAMLPSFGWSAGQFPCLDSLWARESGWRVNAANGSGAYGIPQALPGSKMGAYGSDWRTNPRTQITWGLHYIQDRYSSPCGAWSHFQSHGWY